MPPDLFPDVPLGEHRAVLLDAGVREVPPRVDDDGFDQVGIDIREGGPDADVELVQG